jgi:hypothetical protein
MAKVFMPDLSPGERVVLLQQNAESVRQEKYYKDLTPEELDFKRADLVKNLEHIQNAQEELDEAKRIFKEKAGEKLVINKTLLREVSSRKAQVAGTLYDMMNVDDSTMETYDENGEFVGSRRLTPEEKRGQSRLFVAGSLNKTAEQ